MIDIAVDQLIESIKEEDVYRNYQTFLSQIEENKELSLKIKELQKLLEKKEELSQYSSYISLDDINNEIKDLRYEISQYEEMKVYQTALGLLSDYLEELTHIIFDGISDDLSIGRMAKLYARHRRAL